MSSGSLAVGFWTGAGRFLAIYFVLFAVFGGGAVFDALELSGEVSVVVESHFDGQFVDGFAGFLQQSCEEFHAVVEDVAVDGFAGYLFESDFEQAARQGEHFQQVVYAQGGVEVFVDVV